jgi:hypothetical protein
MTAASAADRAAAPVPKAIDHVKPTLRIHDLAATPTMAVVQSGAKVWMWVDGRSNAISQPLASVGWTERGFEFSMGNGLTRVLAPGGAFYYRIGAEDLPPARPMSSLMSLSDPPPDGFSIAYLDGAGGSRVQAVLTGPEGRRVRLGLYRSMPDAQVWLTGKLPDGGQAVAPVPASLQFRRAADESFVSAPPEGTDPLESTAVPAEQAAQWLAVAQAFRKGTVPLSLGTSIAADLDRDGVDETVLCLDGEIGMLDPRCILVDSDDGETRMYAVGLPWTADGNPPVVFSLDGAPYMMMVSPKEPRLAYVLRYYGAGWIAEPVR